MTEAHKKNLGIAAIAAFLLFFAAAGYFIGRPMIRFVSEPQLFRAWVDASGIWGRVLFVGMVAFQVVVALIPGEPLEIGAGYAFGAVEGTLLSLLGIAIGSALVFQFVRRFGIKLVEAFFPREKILSARFLQDSKRLNRIAFIVFLIPGTPKDLLSYFIGLTDMKFSTWLLIAGVARIPSVVTSTVFGNALGLQRYAFAAAALGIALLLALAGILIYRRFARSRGKQFKSTKEGHICEPTSKSPRPPS